LVAGEAVRTLQQVSSPSVWGHEDVTNELEQIVADEHEGVEKIAV
jgi:hypothetical protein